MPEVLAEAVQTVMRKAGIEDPYGRMKELTRGKAITREEMQSFVRGLEIPDDDKNRLLSLTPDTYLGCTIDLIGHIAP